MQRDPRAFLWDVREAAAAIESFTRGMDAAAYGANAMAQAAVERKFEIIGEALNQLSKLDTTMAPAFPTWRRSWRFATSSSRLRHGERGYRVEHHPNGAARLAARGTDAAGRAGLKHLTFAHIPPGPLAITDCP